MQKKGLIWIFVVVIVLIVVIALLAGGTEEIGTSLDRTGSDLNAVNVDGINTDFDEDTSSGTGSDTPGSSGNADINAELDSIGADLDSTNADSIDTNL